MKLDFVTISKITSGHNLHSAPVSVWQELRGLRNSFGNDLLLEKARLAADNSDWRGYINARRAYSLNAKKPH
jgi:hypothetical protein